MKNKYITNDLVKFGDGTYKIVGPVILGGIWGEDTVPLYSIIPTQGEYFATVVKEEQLDGVPLTPEILEKNGWEKVHDDYIDDNHHLMLCEGYDHYVLYKVINEKVTWLMDISYVHQLQHLLFGLGLESNMIV